MKIVVVWGTTVLYRILQVFLTDIRAHPVRVGSRDHESYGTRVVAGCKANDAPHTLANTG